MKVVFAVLLVAVGANALPPHIIDEYNNRGIVTNQIRKAINQLSKGIKDAGLDPLKVDRYEATASPVPNFVTISALIESLSFTGVSNIAINRLDFCALKNRLRFDISLPQISLSLGNAEVRANIFENRFVGKLGGNLALTQLRFVGDLRVSIGVSSGVSIRTVDVNFGIQNITSAFNLNLQDKDYSAELNTVFNESIPELLKTNKDKINKQLSDLIKEVGNQILSKK